MYFADLHVHTTVSDCSEDVSVILNMAKETGITHIAFTDHDTTKMAPEHISRAEAMGISAISGVEMSACDYDSGIRAHILGYGYVTTSHIEKIGAETLRKRNENCLRQMEILRQLGYTIEEEKIREMALGCIYKQHILAYLLKTGQTYAIFGDVYQKIFKNGGPCDFDIEYPRPEECVQAICSDGGTAVLAHPGQQNNYYLIPRLVESGLKGIEYNHPSHDEAQRKQVQRRAEEFGLLMTGGSDFHGAYERIKSKLGAYPAHESSRALFQRTRP